MIRMVLLVTLALICVAVAACNDSSNTTTNVPNLTADYRGAVIFFNLPDTTTGDMLEMSAHLAQSGNTLSGTWVIRRPGVPDSITGTITGGRVLRVSGTDLTGVSVNATLTSDRSGCPGALTVTTGAVVPWSQSTTVPGSLDLEVTGTLGCVRSGTTVRAEVLLLDTRRYPVKPSVLALL